ncbi:hypothetical protein A1O3_01899 [Capronia epimyces CBS 606.96]|uniref:Uncharacterized protein n=1 Tax=Capronia epimyces CBS 606.96 TaxID=1182542 RepID=W9YGR9_9EURO|nr:uncharacterized protein A1O3_01899 [Capronia epimyces CBS 606.96]EXJ88835.1 hypothetical protein A1O3_01899 [Capronia epimyces CBS 606.96]
MKRQAEEMLSSLPSELIDVARITPRPSHAIPQRRPDVTPNMHKLAAFNHTTKHNGGPTASSPAASEAAFLSSHHAQHRQFSSNASIVLIGLSGSGKSTLAVMAAYNLGRRLVDADSYWRSATGQSRHDYRAKHGEDAYQQREIAVLEDMLERHSDGCVIECSPGCFKRRGHSTLKRYAVSHPVIYIHREREQTQRYLQNVRPEEIDRLLKISEPLYLTCSNFEFYNLTERTVPGHRAFQPPEPTFTQDGQPRSFLALKSTEQSFFYFLKRIFGTRDPPFSQTMDQFPVSPLSEARPYTYLLSVSPLTEPQELDTDDELFASLDAYEVKVDIAAFLDESPNTDETRSLMRASIGRTFALLRQRSLMPVIYHVELGSDSEIPQVYIDLVRYGLRFAPDYVTLDLRCSEEMMHCVRDASGSTQLIAHRYYPAPGRYGWDSRARLTDYLQAWDRGCDLVRLVQPGVTFEDNDAVQRLHHKIEAISTHHPPLIAYNTGIQGRSSVIFNKTLSPVISAENGREDRHLSACITAREAQEALFSSFVLQPLKFWVIGANVDGSLAPEMHTAASKAWGIHHIWQAWTSSSLEAFIPLTEDPQFGGATICLPFKTEIMPLLRSISPAASMIGAVNTVVPLRFEPDPNIPYYCDRRFRRNQVGPVKALHGDNTDWIGFRDCISRNLSPANAVRRGTSSLVLGAGGMARAAVFAMMQMSIENIFIYNRTLSRAQAVADHFNGMESFALDPSSGQQGSTIRTTKVRVKILNGLGDPWPSETSLPTVIVSTLPTYSVGQGGAPDVVLPEAWLQHPSGGVFIEFAYESPPSRLMKQMRSKAGQGWVAVDGLDVLPAQGFAQFEMFTGRIAPRKVMHLEALRAYTRRAPEDERIKIARRLVDVEKDDRRY